MSAARLQRPSRVSAFLAGLLLALLIWLPHRREQGEHRPAAGRASPNRLVARGRSPATGVVAAGRTRVRCGLCWASRPLRAPAPSPLRMRRSSGSLNVNPFRADRSVAARAHALLAGEPLLQLLPYSDASIGVSLLGAARGGKPILLLTYRGSRVAAEADLARLRARLHEASGAMAVETLRIGRRPAG